MPSKAVAQPVLTAEPALAKTRAATDVESPALTAWHQRSEVRATGYVQTPAVQLRPVYSPEDTSPHRALRFRVEGGGPGRLRVMVLQGDNPHQRGFGPVAGWTDTETAGEPLVFELDLSPDSIVNGMHVTSYSAAHAVYQNLTDKDQSVTITAEFIPTRESA